MNRVIHDTIPKAEVIFYGFKTKEIKKLQNKFKLNDATINDLKIAPFLSDGGSIGFMFNKIELDLKGDLSKKFNEYHRTVGTVFKDGDYSYFTLIKVKVQINLNIKSKRIEYEDCHTCFFIF